MKIKYLFTIALIGILFDTLSQNFVCGDTLLDARDSQKYPTVLIGTDCWFKKNLNYGTMVQSDSSGVIHSQQTNNGIAEKYAQHNDATNLSIYGGLYEQAELMNWGNGLQGLCPTGWHVSTDGEWQNLINVAGAQLLSSSAGIGGNKLKALGTGMGASIGTDNVGVSLLPGGDRDGFGIFYGLGLRYLYWTSTESDPNAAWHYMLWAEKDTIQRLSLGTVTTGFSCRCVQDQMGNVNENKFDHFNLYPNPSNSTLHISTQEKDFLLIVYNSIGEAIIKRQIYNEYNSIEVEVKNWPNGIYHVILQNEKNEYSNNVIIQH